MKPSDVIRGALELLPDEDAWSSFGWGEDDSPRRCIVNATITATHLPDTSNTLQKAWSLLCLEAGLSTPGSLASWNDEPHTTFLDVRLVLKRALARAEEDEANV